ncbi:enoyl-CoA hydratase/isomerase family protein [Homoserinimonas sp. OAct 916]|uniref:enoyl-CoA hydratase/isomerase family protein n=1 Tax=Homoserinimonas sp. OAct 916 TaxID=2211450 RepID=UPI000DBE9045|nr:enoyl-CoA hydratase/isomerase family protein [Homoserinimonas sp. OAct 916]
MVDNILFDVNDRLATITLNRPDRYNAFDVPTAHRWRDIAHEVTDRSDIQAVLLAGNGPAFSAGGDVLAMASGAIGAGTAVTEAAEVLHDGIRTLVLSTVPIVAAVHGVTAGGGLGIVLTADYVVAAENATFSSRYANMGLTPDMSVTSLLPRAVGERRALQLLLQDRALSAAEALDWGLVAEVTPEADLRDRARAVARYWLDNAAGAFGQAKHLLRSGMDRDLATNLDEEARSIGAAFETDEAKARIAAFAAASTRRAGHL